MHGVLRADLGLTIACTVTLFACAATPSAPTIAMPALELPAAVAVATGPRHTCSSHVDGSVWCWGAGQSGQLGDGDVLDHARPTIVRGLGDAVQVAVGNAFSCARRRNDAVACWGLGTAGQLGEFRGHLPDRFAFGAAPGRTILLGPRGSTTPVDIPRADQATHLVAAGEHACVRQHSGRVVCWGRMQGTALVDVDGGALVLAPLEGADAIATTSSRICGRLRDLWHCWGVRSDPPTTCVGLPGCGLEAWRTTDAPTLTLVEHVCTVDVVGRVACHGENRFGQLGVGDLRPLSAPEPILGYHRGIWRARPASTARRWTARAPSPRVATTPAGRP